MSIKLLQQSVKSTKNKHMFILFIDGKENKSISNHQKEFNVVTPFCWLYNRKKILLTKLSNNFFSVFQKAYLLPACKILLMQAYMIIITEIYKTQHMYIN